jgi:protoporphyrinogen oxidase
VRAGIRIADESDIDAQVAAAEAIMRDRLGVHGEPVFRSARLWPEGDPLTRYTPEHRANMQAIDALLPPTVRLAGSDYRARRLEDIIADAEAQARAVLAAVG